MSLRVTPEEKDAQNARLLRYLKSNKSITPLKAWRILGIYRLSARIFELKLAGHDIRSNRVPVKNAFGETCRVACYRLELDAR